MIEIEHKLCKEEYEAAGLYGKIVTIPDLIKIIIDEGNKNEIVKTILNHYKLKNSVLGYKQQSKPVICSDGKKRMYIPSPIKGITIDITSSPVEVLIIGSKDDDKCHSIRRYITYDALEEILLTREERIRVETVRLSLTKEKIMGLFNKGYDRITTNLILNNTGLHSNRYNPALKSLVDQSKILKKESGVYALKNE